MAAYPLPAWPFTVLQSCGSSSRSCCNTSGQGLLWGRVPQLGLAGSLHSHALQLSAGSDSTVSDLSGLQMCAFGQSTSLSGFRGYRKMGEANLRGALSSGKQTCSWCWWHYCWGVSGLARHEVPGRAHHRGEGRSVHHPCYKSLCSGASDPGVCTGAKSVCVQAAPRDTVLLSPELHMRVTRE